MGQTIISAIGVYISTSIDYLIALIILFAQLSQNKQKWHIYAGQYLGTGLLVGVSLVAAYVVNFVPEAWMVGLLGLIPIYLGIRFAIVGEGEEEEEEEEIVVGNPEKDEEPVIVPEAPEMPESEQLELPEVTVEPAQTAEVSMKIETNTASTPILAERIKTAGDLRRSISLNDSFRFSRELFGGNMEQMNHVLQQIGEMHSLDAALVFLSSKIKVEEENEAKADLVELLKKYFI